MVCSPDGNANFFDIVTGVLQGYKYHFYSFFLVEGDPKAPFSIAYYTKV